MKKFYFLLSLLILSFSQATAGPIRGAWISYQAIDTNSYTLRVHVIRDCSSTGLVAPTLRINWSQGQLNVPTTLELSRDITGLNDSCSDTTLCNGGTSMSYGFQLQTFKATWDLDTLGSACDFTVSYRDTAQRASSNGRGEAIYVFTRLSRCNFRLENSFELAEIVPLLLQANASFLGGYPVIDSNSVYDSISYELTAALRDSNTSISYNIGFSYTVPFIYTGFPSVPLNLDGVNGNLRFIGALAGQHEVLALRIKGWKRIGAALSPVSEQHIDHDILFGNLGNTPPKMVGPTQIQACALQANCWRFSGQELDTGQNIVPVVLDALPGMTWSLVDSNATDPELELCWTPDTTLIRSRPYFIRIGFKDDNCPYKGYTYQTVGFVVSDPVDSSFLPILHKNRVCGGYQLVVQDSLNRGIPYRWTWDGKSYLADTIDVITNTVGWQVFTYGYQLGPCELILTDSVYVERDSSINIQFSGNSLASCPNSERFVKASVTSGGRAPFQFTWFDNSNLDSVGIISDTTRYWSLRVSDSVGCILRDSVRVPILPRFGFISDSLRLCSQLQTGPFNLSVKVNRGDSAQLNYFWDGFGEGNGYRAVIPLSQQYVALEVRDVYSCSQKDTLFIARYTAQKPNAGPDISNCGGNAIQLKAIDSLPSSGIYEWIGYGFGKQITTSIIGSTTVILKYTDLYGCPTYDSTVSRIYDVPDPKLGNDTTICLDEQVVLKSNHSKGIEPFTYAWNFGLANGDSTTFKVGASVLVFLRLQDSAGCIGRDTILIQAKSRPNLTMTTPAEVCETAGSYALFQLGNPQGGTWSGNGVSNGIFSPLQAGGGSHRLKYRYTSANGCSSEDSVLAKVEPLVNIEFTATPISGRSPLLVNFTDQSTGGVQNAYEWDFGDSSAKSNLINPSHLYTKSGVFNVKLKIVGNLCVSERNKVKYVYVDTFGVGVADFDALQIKAYPNPTKSSITLENLGEDVIESIVVYSVAGQELNQAVLSTFGERWTLDLSGLPAANYLLRVRMKSGQVGVLRVSKE